MTARFIIITSERGGIERENRTYQTETHKVQDQ